MCTDLITVYGYHHGDGATGLIGGMHGDQLYITTIILSGGHSDGIIPYVLHAGFFMPIEYTNRLELLP